MIENVLGKDINGLEPRLTRQGYNAKVLAELPNAKPREIKSFLSGQLARDEPRNCRLNYWRVLAPDGSRAAEKFVVFVIPALVPVDPSEIV
jgi:hypothetical protein